MTTDEYIARINRATSKHVIYQLETNASMDLDVHNPTLDARDGMPFIERARRQRIAHLRQRLVTRRRSSDSGWNTYTFGVDPSSIGSVRC